MTPPLVWIDVETTGLDPDEDAILELGLVATNGDLERYAGVVDLSIVIRPLGGLDVTKLPPAVVEMHSKNGLFAAIANEENTVDWQRAHTCVQGWLSRLRHEVYNPGEEGFSEPRFLMAGSSVGQFDRQFFARAFPDAMDEFAYRVLDVSTIKEVVRRFYGEDAVYTDADAERDGSPGKVHRVIPDIENSISELRYYLNYFKGAYEAGLC